MKSLLIILLFSLNSILANAQIVVCFNTVADQDPASCDNIYCSPNAPYSFSKGIYRIPYEDGIVVSVTNDHIKHCPRGAIDMHGDSGDNEYNIVAAASGWIRAISDGHTQQCTCKNGDNCDNNYVWIEHPNGEWTKYTHVRYHTASDLHDEGDWVNVGNVIGIEGTVGCSTGDHCHFEVATPLAGVDDLHFDTGGGWIDEDSAMNLVPLFCNISGYIMKSGESYIAVDCPNNCDVTLPSTNTTYSGGTFKAFIDNDALSTTDNILFQAASSGVMQGGSSITLNPGFQAEFLSTFEARTGSCSGAGFNKATEYAAGEANEDLSIEPNPASQTTVVKWEMIQPGAVKMMLCDISGHALITLMDAQPVNAGRHQQSIDLSSLASGAYYLLTIIDGRQLIRKIIVQQ
ncbi:MAG: peptidoglycan DD-metalloendopeptidase family protein [Chitinophagales bacterium]|nr:peptidoglycan DD-metalloendopeptidase family protein [Chitinophagales bacterium]